MKLMQCATSELPAFLSLVSEFGSRHLLYIFLNYMQKSFELFLEIYNGFSIKKKKKM